MSIIDVSTSSEYVFANSKGILRLEDLKNFQLPVGGEVIVEDGELSLENSRYIVEKNYDRFILLRNKNLKFDRTYLKVDVINGNVKIFKSWKEVE